MGIYTCTMNPAIDMFISTQKMENNKVNRTDYDELQANGKGVNVSLILKKLSINSTALGFIAGFTGKYIQEELERLGIKTDFVEVSGTTRVNVFTQVLSTNEEYKLVNKGPVISQVEQDELLKKISLLSSEDYLVVSGSLPQGVTVEIFPKIGELCKKKNVKLILDISDSVLLDCLRYQPFLIKPNEEELAAWFKKERLNRDEIIKCGMELNKLGARNVLISLGKDGAILINEGGPIYECNAPKGKVINTAGAGDTLLATFLANLINGYTTSKSLVQAVAAGSSTAFQSGLTDFSDVDSLATQINIKKAGV